MDDVIRIRRAVESDAPIIDRITKTAFEDYAKLLPSPPDALTETIDHIEEDIRTKMVFVAELNRNTVGTVRLEQKDDKIYLSRFAVRPTSQNSGIGKYILEYADIISKINGAKEIYLHTASKAEKLMKLYESCGYKILEITTDRGYERAKLVKHN